MDARKILDRLQLMADDEKARVLQRFFKTGPGEYGEGDLFLGIRVPETRKLAKEYRDLPLTEALHLLQSPLHEARLLALLLLVEAYRRGAPSLREEVYRSYCRHTPFINGWDLVDSSAEHIVGAHLSRQSREPLYRLAVSPLIWERRIAIMATFHYIKKGEFNETLQLAQLLLNDREDLIHKAVGWMLREIGNRDREPEEAFLRRHHQNMPRTMLRYAIEKFPEELRQKYLKGTV